MVAVHVDLDEKIRERFRKADEASGKRGANGSSPGAKLDGGETEASALAFDLTAWDARSAFQGEPPAQIWLVGHAIPRGVAGIIAAAGDTGKSFMLLELCLRVTRGPARGTSLEYPIFGGPVQSHGAAVFVTAEDGRAAVHRRLRAVDPDGRRQANRQHPLYVVPLPDAGGPFPITVEERGSLRMTPQYDALRERLRAISDLALVVLDPLQTFALVDVNADPKAAAFVMANLNMLAAETGATVLVAHHVRKDKEAPKNAQEARHLIRGSSALVDQARVAVVLWAPEEKRARQVCKALDAVFAPHAVVHGAVVKSNDGASRKEWTLLRGSTGLLRDVSSDLAVRGADRETILKLLTAAIAAGAMRGRPYTKTGLNGLYTRRGELGEELAAVSKGRFEELAQDLEQSGKIVTALANGTSVRWLDVPEGPFAQGVGAFAAGAGNGKGRRRGAAHGR